jgi:hypothetical protein
VQALRPELRPIAPIAAAKPLRCAPVAPAPKVAHIGLEQLVIDEAYQRELSARGLRLIRRIAERWDWNSYKPLSVAAAGDGRYEVIDGQHTAIAAASTGAIETLPCLVLSADTVADRARAFVGINSERLSLTPYALFRARVAAGDLDAVAVQAAVTAAGVELRQSFSNHEEPPIGSLSCVSSLLQIQRHSPAGVLERALKVCKAAEFAPVSSQCLKAVAQLLAGGSDDEDLAEALLDLGPDDLADRAAQRRKANLAPDGVTAAEQVILASLQRRGAA